MRFDLTLIKVTGMFSIFWFFSFPAYSQENIKITGVAGIQPPPLPLADTSMPDILLDSSLSGAVNVDVSTFGVPDGTKVRVKFKDENIANPPEGMVESGKATIPVTLNAGNVKVLYAETDPFIPLITKSASGGKLDSDSSTVALYHLDNTISDNSGHGFDLTYYPGWEAINYVDGISASSKGIYFWVTPGTYENRRVHRYGNPNGTGFTSSPLKWSSEFSIKPLWDAPSETWNPFLLQDQNILTWTFLGKSPFTGEDNKFVVWHFDSKGSSHSIEIPNPTMANSWTYLTITHDGEKVKLYVNGEEKGSVLSEGNLGPHAWGNYGVAAGGIFSGNGAKLVVDEIRISNVVRNREELLSNAGELLGTNFKFRSLLASKDDKGLKFALGEKKKKIKVEKEIRAQVATTAPGEKEPKADNDTVALFHFNGTTKDSVTKKVLVGDPDTINFDEGRNEANNSSINFEGKDDLLLVNKKLFSTQPKEWTIDFFSKPDDSNLPLPIGILTIDNGQIFAMTSYLRTPDGRTILQASSLDSHGKPVVIGAEASFPPDKWTHLALVYQDKKLRFLVNGKPLGEAELPTLYKKGEGEIHVGSDGGDGIFSGQIDELRISDVARSDAELEVYAKR